MGDCMWTILRVSRFAWRDIHFFIGVACGSVPVLTHRIAPRWTASPGASPAHASRMRPNLVWNCRVWDIVPVEYCKLCCKAVLHTSFHCTLKKVATIHFDAHWVWKAVAHGNCTHRLVQCSFICGFRKRHFSVRRVRWNKCHHDALANWHNIVQRIIVYEPSNI